VRLPAPSVVSGDAAAHGELVAAVRMGPMRLQMVDELEDFVGKGALWDDVELSLLIARLEREADEHDDPIPRLLSQPLRSVLVRMQMKNVSPRMVNDVEGIVYPRVWKVMEAVRDGLPDGELRTRIEVLNRRLARRFAEEQPG
jgi:hypothetical protein